MAAFDRQRHFRVRVRELEGRHQWGSRLYSPCGLNAVPSELCDTITPSLFGSLPTQPALKEKVSNGEAWVEVTVWYYL